MTDAFDTDALVFAAAPGHPLGRRVAALFSAAPEAESVGVGATLLIPEALGKPLRTADTGELGRLSRLLARLELLPLDRATAELAAGLAADYGLKAADATHLATAIKAGADRFVTNNRRDFPRSIVEVDVVYPDDLPDPVAV